MQINCLEKMEHDVLVAEIENAIRLYARADAAKAMRILLDFFQPLEYDPIGRMIITQIFVDYRHCHAYDFKPNLNKAARAVLCVMQGAS